MTEIFAQIGSSPWFTIVCSFITMVIGYRLGIHSERRKEYNELADPLFAKVNATVSEAAGHTFGISDLEIVQIRRRMSLPQRLRFDAAIAAYKEAAETTVDPVGQVFFTNVDAVNDSLKRIAKVLYRK